MAGKQIGLSNKYKMYVSSESANSDSFILKWNKNIGRTLEESVKITMMEIQIPSRSLRIKYN